MVYPVGSRVPNPFYPVTLWIVSRHVSGFPFYGLTSTDDTSRSEM